METKERVFLRASVKPILYEIRLNPSFDDEIFAGHVKISCTVIDTCSSLELHCRSINVNQARVEFKHDSWDVLDTVGYNDARETLKIELPRQVTPGNKGELQIVLSYRGNFTRDLTGLYQASYETDDGVKHRIAATAMEPTYAREVFPCFDEPSIKAEFTISIVVEHSFVTVSNMPVEKSESISASKKLVTFQKTMPMSTYHVGLVAGPLAEAKCTSSRIPISVFSPLGSEQQAAFAVDLAAKGLQFFEDCFDLPYPLPKLDLIGVPEFSTGAMENWGAIIFRTTNLLLDPEDSALDTKQRIAETILHEISHMWFGNLVTMQYWDGLWLKEGFATLMSWYTVDKLFPSWHFWDSYVANTLQKALSLDSLTSSHSVELFVPDSTDAKQIYDEISYQKGSCVLRMVLNNLGDTKFFQGLKLYLGRHQFQCTESDDLWRAWEEVTGDSIATSMRVWTKEPGFPVLRVSDVLTTVESGVTNQESEVSDTIYPLRFAIRHKQDIETIDMNSRELILPPRDGLFKVNADHGSFFRTSYSPELLTRLLEEASKGSLSLRDCIGLSCDLKALVAAGLNKTSEILDLNVKFAELDSFYVWEMIDRNLRSIQSVYKFHGSELNEALGKLTRDVIGPKAEELGWTISKDDDENLVTFKTLMFSGAGLAGHPTIVSAAKELFAKRMAGDESAIPGSLRWEVFGIVAAHGGLEELQGLVKLWEKSPNEDEQYLALECLGRAPNSELMRWVLGFLLTDTVKNHDVSLNLSTSRNKVDMEKMFYLTWLAGDTAHGAIELWEWTKQNWARVEKEVPVDILSLFLGTSLEGLHTEEQIQDVRAFFAARDTKSYRMVLDQKLEGMENRRSWADRDISDVRSWLKAHDYL
ncbi:hypothetical protein IL306_011868 [Fusarium sp. DS 682]|nr:hypothetical protein IL306_011868 [Fusarium sp. DS 682]